MKPPITIVLLFLYVRSYLAELIDVNKNGLSLRVTSTAENLFLSLYEGDTVKLNGIIGTNLKDPSNYQTCQDVANCYEFENGTVRLHIMNDIDDGFTLYWITEDLTSKFEDCFELSSLDWFGGPERSRQVWPLQKLTLNNFANVPQRDQFGAVVEGYWLNSLGAYIFVNDKVPLFINQNGSGYAKNKVCFSAKLDDIYYSRKKVVLHYTVVSQTNAKEAHLHAVRHFLGKPSGHPNYKVIERPIWSTWARYKTNINDATILNFANEIVDNGYPDGQFEIDDDWEECYGALSFNPSKFGNITNTVAKIKSLNFRVSLWTHPFVNVDCTKYSQIGRKHGYFVKNTRGSDLTQWWNSKGNDAHYLDFTNPEVRAWFIERLRNIKEKHGIDSFKFDAGEVTWPPQVPVLSGDVDSLPSILGSDYVRTCAQFGDLIEVRVGWRTQDLPVFVRMLDKDSKWGLDNGLHTLITTLLQMNMNGYSMVLPDMVGGNGYQGRPDAELFVRWLQANTFMPSIQFSYVPWDYNGENLNFDVNAISYKYVSLHQKIAPYIKERMEATVSLGYPVNPPIWWVSPQDKDALKEDTEFLLGEDVLVAPVIKQGGNSRDVYLPEGVWVDGNNGTIYRGSRWLLDYKAPIEVLPYFVREGSQVQKILEG